MKNEPRLLNFSDTGKLPRELFSDLQVDKILSAQTISVLEKPCGSLEKERRNELFRLLEQESISESVENLRLTLSSYIRALQLYRDAKIGFDRFHRYFEMLSLYAEACELLASMGNAGSLFLAVADAYSAEDFKTVLADVKKTSQKISSLLEEMHTGLLSFSDKCWLTPDCEAESELDRIMLCATSMGFSVPPKKRQNTKINVAFSDAICRLHAKAADEIESEIERLAGIDWYAPTVYLEEIRFYLEIRSLITKAKEIGIPHTVAKIAKKTQYMAKDLYDVSLLAKKCDTVIPNDAEFGTAEPFCFLLGANGGGKTTYLRALGINLILFLAGCPVFAKQAEIYPFDLIEAHFPKDERFEHIGRLDEERTRVLEMLAMSEDKTAFLLFNETFSGTDEARGFDLLKDTAAQIAEKGHFGVFVTHFHEVLTLDFPVLSAEVDASDENRRTYRIARTKGRTMSYAADILKKYRLDRESLAKRRDEREN